MANKRIDELTLLDKASITPASDVLAMVDVSDSNNTKKVTIESAVQSTLRDAGVANGVLYLNGSKVATSGSALTFDGANLGIGASSPSAKLHVSAVDSGTNPLSATYGPRINIANTATSSSGNGSTLSFQSGTGTNPVYAAIAGYMQGSATGGAYGDIVFGTKSDYATVSPVERMRIDASGNLGLGVTPSAWGASVRGFQMQHQGALSTSADGFAYRVDLGNNYYASGANTYNYLDSASKPSRYMQRDGAHSWYTAPSGTAGQPISFTQAMTLDTSGNLLVGTTSKTSIAAGGVVLGNLNNAIGGAVSGGILTMSGATTTSYVGLFSNPNGSVGSITIAGTTTAYNTASDYRLKDNQAPLTNSGAFIDALKPKTWNWKADGTKGVGFIAHEVQEVSPTSVVGEKDATRIEQYEVSPAVPATYDEEGNELTPAVEAVMGEREVPAYQAMEYGSAEFIANIVAELQSLRKRVAALEAK